MKTLILILVAIALFAPLAYGEVYSNIVGLYKVNCGVGRNLVSMPFLPFNSTLDNVIGNQLTGSTVKTLSDNIEWWDPIAMAYQRAWFNTTQQKWLDWNTGGAPFNFNPDQSYWINIIPVGGHTAKTLTLLGEVSETNRSITVRVGKNMVAPSFPKEMTLGNSGLVASGFTGHTVKTLSDSIEWWNNATGAYFRVWYKTSDATWRDWDGNITTKSILPGEGFWVTVNPIHAAFTWVVPKPY